MLELKSVKLDDNQVKVNYRIEHWGPQTVVHDDSLIVSWWSNLTNPKFSASIDITDCEADTYEEALDKLARWMEQLAIGIRNRGKPLEQFSPMYTNVVEKPTHVSIGIEEPHASDWL